MTLSRTALGFTALAALVASVSGVHAAGGRERPKPAADAGTQTLAPAVVMATRPTLDDIVSLVLRERPTAAELGEPAGRAFPAGSDEAHVAGILRRHASDDLLVQRIAASLVKEGRRRSISSDLLVGVLLTENPWLDPRAMSFVGARGLMQVMPFHAGKWGCASPDLWDVEANICHGVAVLADNLQRSRTLPRALLGYNGCVRGRNTPDCFRYPNKVFRHARKGAAAGDKAQQPFSYR